MGALMKAVTAATVLFGLTAAQASWAAAPVAAAAPASAAGQAAASPADQATIKQGQYLAIAADCAACHRQVAENGLPFAGGYAIASPMGPIVASNITPSKQYGIGNYTEQQFSDAVRRGVAADGHNLYPAMPYTSYGGLSDTDVHALYAYFMQGVKAADIAPTAHTNLGFPFSVRQVMWGWNLLYRHDQPFQPQPGVSAQLNRGRYLVDTVAHCSACHTPRTPMMAENGRLGLSGAQLGGWYAPNITPDASGIGAWSEADIVAYLGTGHVAGKAQAAGPMAEAVENSFRYMSAGDLQAIAAWMKQVAPIQTPVSKRSAEPAPVINVESVIAGQGTQASLAASDTINGAQLYMAACATCHGVKGDGTHDNFYPSLGANSAVTGHSADNLVMTIVEGIHRKSADSDVAMPAFGQQMSDAQIAAVSNYVRLSFAGINDPVTQKQVSSLRRGGDAPFIVAYVDYLIAAGVLVVLLLILGIVYLRRRARRKR